VVYRRRLHTWDTSWCPSPGGPESTIAVLARQESTLYVGGEFSRIAGAERRGLAAFDVETGMLLPWGPRVSGRTIYVGLGHYADPQIYAIAVDGSRVYLGGLFSRINGEPRRNLAAVDAVTGQLTDWDPQILQGRGLRPDSRDPAIVLALAVRGRVIYVGGRFGLAGGQRRGDLAAINVRSGRVTGWNPRVEGRVVNALALDGSHLLVGGEFWRVAGKPRSSLAAIDAATGRPLPWRPRISGRGPSVSAVTVTDSQVVVGGRFLRVNGDEHARLVAFGRDLGAPTGWRPRPNDDVYALASDGVRVAVGGRFSGVGGEQRCGLAALDAGTGEIKAWAPHVRDEDCGFVKALAVSDGRLYVGGSFTTVDNEKQENLAAFDLADGRLSSWRPPAPNDYVWALEPVGGSVFRRRRL
jgi:outer membrane protein assembly factor BamB